jgi:2-oxoisovalerate dehydrogenase E2 component (dihydrolipoyl transacylase)
MARYTFKLPDIGEGGVEAEIAAWRVAVGDRVAEDGPLVDVMTNKATVEMYSPVAGTVLSLNGQVGDIVPVGSDLVVFEVEGAEVATQTPIGAAPTRAIVESPAGFRLAPAELRDEPVQAVESSFPTAVESKADRRPLCSPSVRQRARELGIELKLVSGSGPAGRIGHADLEAFLEARRQGGATRAASPRAAAHDEITEIKIIGLRRKIAEKMQDSTRRIPHFTYVEEVDVTELESLRGHLNATKTAGEPKLTPLPFLMRALVEVLRDSPQINARFDDEAGLLRRYRAVHIGIATQTPNGLMAPVVRHAQTLDVWQSAREVLRLAEAARSGKASAEELSGGTITLTSLGPLGGIAATPVINHPEVAIVGPNKIVERPVVIGDRIVIRKMMNLSCSFDHRIVDGYDAAAFTQKVKAMLEHPATLFMDRS